MTDDPPRRPARRPAPGRRLVLLGVGLVLALDVVVAVIALRLGIETHLVVGAGVLAVALGGFQVFVFRDITAARRRETGLRAEVDELERLQQERDAVDALKRDFLAMASHEIRTPITAIRGFSMTLRRHWARLEDDERERSLEAMERQATRLWELTSDLLIAANLETGSVSAGLPRAHVADALDEVVTRHRSDLRVSGWTQVDVRIEQRHLVRILRAMVTNAAKYGRPPIDATVAIDGRDVVIRVRDHGDGVPESFQDRLFEPFAQASTGIRREASGTGLGLTVARGLARAAGGDVWFEQRPEPGAVFAVRLPLAESTPAPDAPARAEIAAPALD